MFKKSIFVLLSMFLFLSTGCFSSGTSETDTGKLFLDISMGNSKTLLPGIDMVPAEYAVTGVGPGDNQFNVSGANSSVELTELAFGEWTVTVDALNAEGTVIARGSETITVHTGELTTANIVVSPLEGDGTLDLTLQWNAADTETPSIEAQLVDSSGTVRDLSFVINNGNTGVFTDTAVAAGYYTLVVKLLDNSIYTMGAVEIVRIVAGETTTGQLEFTEINKPGGNMLLNITADMEEPVKVTLTDIPAELSESSSSAVVTASVPVDVGTVTYAWYLNGELVYTGLTADPEYTIPVSTLTVGNVYRLDAAVVSSDGKRAGSVSDTFTVIVNNDPPVPNMAMKLTASDGSANDWFGSVSSISDDGNTIVVGAHGDDDYGNDSGSIYVYQWNSSTWNETKIRASDGATGNRFGSSVAVSADGNTVVAGASIDDDNGMYSGSMYIYKWNGSTWIETKITPSDGTEGDLFGTGVTVSADGNTVITGAPMDDNNEVNSGSVYIYRWNGSSWNETKITALDGANSDLFGAALTVSTDGNTVVVGASMDDDSGYNSGSVYIYKWNGSDWIVTKLRASDGMPNDVFGSPVSISGDGTILVVGAPSVNAGEGGIYIYRWDGSTWNESKLIPSASNGINNFGDRISISTDGNTLVVGCHKDDEMSVDSGAIFLYKWDGSLWNETKHMAPDSATEDNFGYSVSLSSDGSTILAGARGADDMGNDSGAVYIYK